MTQSRQQSSSQRHLRLDVPLFMNVLLAAIVVGGLAHEMIHTIFIPYTVKFTIDFSNPQELLYVCCFLPGEEPEFQIFLSLFVQFVTMVAWLYLNRTKFIKEFKGNKEVEKKERE